MFTYVFSEHFAQGWHHEPNLKGQRAKTLSRFKNIFAILLKLTSCLPDNKGFNR
jgi:hypothetical protein